MTIVERIYVLNELGNRLTEPNEYLEAVMKRTAIHNGWLTVAHQKQAIEAIVSQFLSESKLVDWTNKYKVATKPTPKRVGLIMAGNIPLVGFHDFLCIFVSGNHAKVKVSSKDPYLFPYLIKLMTEIDERVASYIEIVEQLRDFDAVIATGSNNSAKYFESYFGKVPNIIRKNRNGVAILSGKETKQELIEFGHDVFDYFGLGCRNVSKIYVPIDYDFDPLLEALHTYNSMVLHTKYKNNFDYNYAVFMLNKEKFHANGCIMLLERSGIPSNIATLHYEYYNDLSHLDNLLETQHEKIQVIIASNTHQSKLPTMAFGEAQCPQLADYADGIDTMNFLVGL